MKKTKTSNVASGILSRSVLKGDPVFSQENSSNKKAIKNDNKKRRKLSVSCIYEKETLNDLYKKINENVPNKIFSKPATNQKEKGLKQSATKGVVKFLNMIVNYQENLNSKTNKSANNQSDSGICTEIRKLKSAEFKIKPNRFGAVVGMHSDN
ncbi:uncharacterized protein cubi_01048 [Cryptosporidium ubiquitum]|uniref:Uncharacterized protein n=1 Tax=Cryptosporidium ubiquitum TaxID=857276 RepID=A0A1J4MMH0_9CRYT|nr:uncharacterized protein cubi_01048 [Cryptosporidium ubiquitum]OII74204.1 hypothetical protein cubi_01048 [Cryptosporidium ubiquitum]